MADSNFSSVVFLARFYTNGAVSSFTDTIGNVLTGSGDAQIVTSSPMLTGHALQLDGSGDDIHMVGTAALKAGSSLFTVDGEFITTATSGVIVSATGTDNWYVAINSSGGLDVIFRGGSYKSSSAVVNDGNKHHFALVKTASSSFSLFIDGVKDGASFSYGNDFLVTPPYFSIGSRYDGTTVNNPFNGKIGFVRFTVGVARWTTTFTVPTLADIGAIYPVTASSAVAIGDSGAAYGIFPTSVSEYVNMGDGVVSVWLERLTAGLVFSTSVAATKNAAAQVIEGLALAASVATSAKYGASVASSVSLSDASIATLRANASAVESLKLYTAELTTGNIDEAIQTWVANLATSAHSRYSHYGFNSFAYFEGKHYGCKSDGIYELGGDTDGANPIPWTVTVGETDFGASNLKRFESVYLGVKATGQLVLKVIKDDGTVYHYNVIPSGNDNRAARAVLGRGLAGRYWNLELASDTERVELDSIDFSFAVMSRRV